MSLRIYGPVGSDGGSIPTTPGESTPGTGSTDGSGAGTSAGPQSFTHTQTEPASVWRFTHNLGFDPAGMRIIDGDTGAEWHIVEEYDAPSRTYTLRFPHLVRGTVTVS